MSITSISTPPTWYRSQLQEADLQIRKGFADLTKALQASDVKAAQSAFVALQQLQPGHPQGTNTNSPVNMDFATLGKALQMGDVKAAQNAVQQFQHGLQSMRHGHHHHHANRVQSASATPGTDTNAGGATDSDGSKGSRINIFA